MKKIILIFCAILSSQSFTMEKDNIANSKIFHTQTNQPQVVFDQYLPNELLCQIIFEDYIDILLFNAESCHVFKQEILNLRLSSPKINNTLEELFSDKYIIYLAKKRNDHKKYGKPTSFYILAKILLSNYKFEKFKELYGEQSKKLGEDLRNIFNEYRVVRRRAMFILTISANELRILDAINAITKLISQGADINLKESHGHTILLSAVIIEDTSIVQLFVDAYADLNIMDNDGYTATMVAAKHGHIDILKILINGKANLDLQSKRDGGSALIEATFNSSTLNGRAGKIRQAIKMLIDAKANIDLKNNYGKKMLDYAPTEVVKMLEEAKSNGTKK